MKLLKKSDLKKVKPAFRKIARDCLNRGEKVPYSIIHLADPKIPLTKAELEHIYELNQVYKWK